MNRWQHEASGNLPNVNAPHPRTDWSIILPTHNRCAVVLRTLARLQRLRPAAAEILVAADGCDDDTVAAIRARFPQVRVLETAGLGSIGARDRLLREAAGDWVLSLDDDSYPIEDDFLARAEVLVAEDPTLAVVCFPQRSDEYPGSLTQNDFGPPQWIGSYTSSGACIRRRAYLDNPGYPPFFFHAYEEPDFALQCWASGWTVRFQPGLHIRHEYTAVNRNEIRTHHFHARNEQWSVWLRCPWPWWPLVSLRRAAGQFRYACRRGPDWIVREPLWWGRALAGFARAWRERRPVPWPVYRRWLRLLRGGSRGGSR